MQRERRRLELADVFVFYWEKKNRGRNLEGAWRCQWKSHADDG